MKKIYLSSHLTKKLDGKYIEGRLTFFGTPYMQTVQVSRKTTANCTSNLALKFIEAPCKE